MANRWGKSAAGQHRPHTATLGRVRRPPFYVDQPYSVVGADRLKHLAISGATGTGKSTLLANLIASDIRNGAGVCVIDPKDNLIDRVLAHVPPSRTRDVILLDATDTERPLGFNPLSGIPPERRSLAASELIAVFHRYFADAWGPRLEHILTNAVLALLETPNATLLDISRLLLDPNFADWVRRHVRNPGVLQFFDYEYEQITKRRDAVQPVLNKIGPWLAYPELRGIIGQPRSSFSIRQIMDQGKILLVRIPQGALGESISSPLGAFVVAKIQLAAQSRVDAPSDRRRPFYLYVDEFQNFATSSFSRVLTEARAFGLGLVCANQYPEQLDRDLQLAISRNVGTSVACRYQQGRYRLEVTRLDTPTTTHSPIILTPERPLPPGDTSQSARIRAFSAATYGRPLRDPVSPSPGRREAAPRSRTASVAGGSRVDVDED
jgi:hypothetical protein